MSDIERVLTTTTDKDAIYNQCDNCKRNEAHLHYLIVDNDPPEFSSLDGMVEKVTAERIAYHNEYGKDGFGSERTCAETYLNHERIKEEAIARLQSANCRLKLIKVACHSIYEIEGDVRCVVKK